jgi:hypothetical protein
MARLDQAEELLVGDIRVRPVRHCDGEVLGELEAQAAAVLWMRKNSERKGQSARGRRSRWEAKSRTSARRTVLKGGRLDSSPSKPGPPCQRDFRPRMLPGETTAHSRDTSVPVEYGLAESARSHDGAVTSSSRPRCPHP